MAMPTMSLLLSQKVLQCTKQCIYQCLLRRFHFSNHKTWSNWEMSGFLMWKYIAFDDIARLESTVDESQLRMYVKISSILRSCVFYDKSNFLPGCYMKYFKYHQWNRRSKRLQSISIYTIMREYIKWLFYDTQY